MKIYYPNFVNRNNFNNNMTLVNRRGESQSFQGKINKDAVIRLFHLNPMRHFKNFTADEYKNLSNKEVRKLRNRYEKGKKACFETNLKYMEKVHHDVAKGIQSTLDTLYGKNNYKVIIIGRSLSSVGKVLGYRIGEDNVINIPLSQAYRYMDIEDIIPSYLDSETAYLNKFLVSRGLGKDDIKSSSKHYIVTDYCCSGASLKGAKNLFSHEKVWGKHKRIHYADFMELLPDEIIARHSDLRSMMSRENFKPFSFVYRLIDFADIQNSFKLPYKELYQIKLFWFKLLDNEFKNIPGITSKG